MFIKAENLTRTFGGLNAVDLLNLEIGRGEVFGLVGPDGAGKTTTLRMMCGLLDPTEGRVSVAGHDVTKDPDAVKDRIGYMAQKFGLYGDLTVDENMQFYADLFGISAKDRSDLTKSLLEMTRMAKHTAYQVATITSFLPAFLLSGFIYAIENMPPVIQAVTYLIPARYFVTVLKGIFLKGVGLDVLWMEFLFLSAYAAGVFFIAVRKLRQKVA